MIKEEINMKAYLIAARLILLIESVSATKKQKNLNCSTYKLLLKHQKPN
jgi:hypothetical protein